MATILVVDDQTSNRDFLTTLLGYTRHRVLEAADGIEALEMASGEHPDLVITDVLMPRMDGMELATRMRADPKLAATPVIFYTATYHMAQTRELAKQCGVKFLIGKPADPELILNTVSEALGEAKSTHDLPIGVETIARPATDGLTERFLQSVESPENLSLRLGAVIEVCLTLSAERDPARMLERFCRSAAEILSARYAVAAIAGDSGGRRLQLAAHGYDNAVEKELRSAAERSEFLVQLPTSRAIINRTARREAAPAPLGLPPSHPTAHSLLAVALHNGTRDLGWICFVNKLDKASFNAEDERIAQILGALISASYESARLHDEVRQHTEKLRLEIVERRTAEEMLRSREAQLASLTTNHPGMVIRWVMSRDGRTRYTFVSDRAYEMMGRASHEFVDDPSLLESLIVPEDRDLYKRAFARSAGGLSNIELDFRFSARSCGEKWGRLISTQRRLANGDTIWDGLILDITQQKALEQQRLTLEKQLQHSQKLEAVGTLTGGMAHDFNNLLLVIMGNLSMLQERVRGNPLHEKLAAAAGDAAQRGAELIRRLLAFARRQPLEPLSFDMSELVKSMMRLLAQTLGEQIEISVNVAPKLWFAFADPSQVESALANLAVNARDAMPKGGTLTVNVRNVTLSFDDIVENRGATPGDYVLLEVTDTGTGMSAETQAHAFEPFFTTKEIGKGSGLGLSMIYGFAKQSGGHIQLSSEEGKGTSVQLYIPRAKSDETRRHADRSAAPPAAGHGETVLLVDDKDDVRQMAALLLNDLGYSVLEAASPKQALELLAAGKEIDVLFTDVVMPGGIDGPELARRATIDRPNLRVLYTSGFPDAPRNSAGKLPRNRRLLGKPYKRNELARALREILDSAPAN